MKITVVGGGSTHSPELVSGFLERTATLPVRELWLMNNDPERLEIVGGFIQRMVAAAGNPFSVQPTDDREQAYVIQLSVRRSSERCGW